MTTTFHGTWAIIITDYHGITITHQYDTRGEEYGEIITAEIDGVECDFNSIDEARNYIDEVYDIDSGFDAVAEWGIRGNLAL